MALVTVGRSMCARPLLVSPEDTFCSFIFIPPVLVVHLREILSNQSMRPFVYFKLKIVLIVTQFWVSSTHGLEFSQSRIFGSVLATFIATTKYVARLNITIEGKEGFILADGVRECSPSCMVGMIVGTQGLHESTVKEAFSRLSRFLLFIQPRAPAHEMVSPISSIRSSSP